MTLSNLRPGKYIRVYFDGRYLSYEEAKKEAGNRKVVKVFNVPPNDYDFFSVKTYSGSFKVI